MELRDVGLGLVILGVNTEYTEAGTVEQIRCSEVPYRATNSSESLVEQ